MKLSIKVILTFLLLISALLVAPFGEAWAGPRAVLRENLFDAGNVKEGERVSHDFIVSNPGDEPLEILKVAPG